MVLAAIEAMAQTDPKWPARGRDSDATAEAPAEIALHAESPARAVGPNG